MCNRKSFGMILLVVLMISIAPISTFADSGQASTGGEGGIITPYWSGVASIYSDLNCSAGKANPQIYVEVDPGKVDKVNFKGDLLQYKSSKWTTIASWNVDKQVSLGRSIFDESYSITKGYDYKFVTTVKAYKGGTLVDTINVESSVENY